MYLSFYELKKKPFQTSSDPAFLWMGEKHREALAMLEYGIKDNRGFIMLTGDVGTGKTTLLNALRETLGPDVVTADISNPGLEKLDFLNFLAASFGLKETFGNKGEFILRFEEFLETCHRSGKQVLLIIDEAQHLTREMMEEIRLLSNIERKDVKLLNIFFVGQDELDSILDRHENRALRQRMTLSYHLDPLSENEIGEFIAHRLKVAGAVKRIFTKDAVREIYSFSKGYPRLANIICDHAMLTGYVANKKIIGADEVRECVAHLKLPKVNVTEPSPPPPAPEPAKTLEKPSTTPDPAKKQKRPETAPQADDKKAHPPQSSEKSGNFDDLIGREVGTATLIKELSRDGAAVIFTAYQKSLKRQIAVKILPKPGLTLPAAESFQQKAELASILSHPNIAQIYETGDAGDFLFFTMQLGNGKPLSGRLELVRKHPLPSKRILPLQETMTIIRGVLDALDYAHDQDIIHGEMKPANILVDTRTNRPIVTGFGVARLSRTPDKVPGSTRWHPLYVAPEQIKDEAVDIWTDIYSVAVILFEMLVPELPLPKAATSKELIGLKWILKDRFFQKKPSELNPNIDREMDEIIFRALSFYPEKRYATSRAFWEDLNQYRTRHMKTNPKQVTEK